MTNSNLRVTPALDMIDPKMLKVFRDDYPNLDQYTDEQVANVGKMIGAVAYSLAKMPVVFELIVLGASPDKIHGYLSGIVVGALAGPMIASGAVDPIKAQEFVQKAEAEVMKKDALGERLDGTEVKELWG